MMNRMIWRSLLFAAAIVSAISPAVADTNSNAAIRARPQDIADYNVNGSGNHIVQIDTEVSLNHPGLAGRFIAEADFTNEGLLTPDTEFFAYNSGAAVNPFRIWVN